MKRLALIFVLAFLASLLCVSCGGGNSNNKSGGDEEAAVESEEIAEDDAEFEEAAELELESVSDADLLGDEEETPETIEDAAADFDEELQSEDEPEIEEEAPYSHPTCDALGLPAVPFENYPSSAMLYDFAADLTIPTTEGDWNLKKNYSGCETYLFIQDKPKQNQNFSTKFWNVDDVGALLKRLPKNARVFFVSWLSDDAARAAALDDLKIDVESNLFAMPQADQDWLRARIHYVTAKDTTLPIWLGKIMRSPGWGAAIDRFQRVRYIGSYADPRRYNSTVRWFEPNVMMAANEAIYFNYEAERQAKMDEEGADVVALFKGEAISDANWAGIKGYAEAVLPNAEKMTAYDSMEFDLYLGCVGDGEYGTCPAWDYIASLYLCDDDEPDKCEVEIGRWITTYHREGRWLHDASPLLPLLASGGKKRFAFYTQQPYETTLSIRLFNKNKGFIPKTSHYLFSGGGFDANYNSKYKPINIALDADVKKAELAVVLSGHGMSEPGNCAEFCNTTHIFTVNGTENVIDFPDASSNFGCMEETVTGTVPNQYGTWWYGRGGWCPGRHVPIRAIDVTAQIAAGAENIFEYKAFYNGAPYSGPSANIDLTSWLTIYK